MSLSDASPNRVVSILVTSRQEDAGQVEETVQSHEGTLHTLDGVWYLRYEAEGVNTTLRLSEGELRLMRRGSMDHWQSHRAGEWTGGALDLGGGPLLLRLFTERYEFHQPEEGPGRVHLRYTLHPTDQLEAADGEAPPVESLGTFILTMAWDRPADLEAI